MTYYTLYLYTHNNIYIYKHTRTYKPKGGICVLSSCGNHVISCGKKVTRLKLFARDEWEKNGENERKKEKNCDDCTNIRVISNRKTIIYCLMSLTERPPAAVASLLLFVDDFRMTMKNNSFFYIRVMTR